LKNANLPNTVKLAWMVIFTPSGIYWEKSVFLFI